MSEFFPGLGAEPASGDREIELGEISKLLPMSPGGACSLKIENDDLVLVGGEITEMEVSMMKASAMKYPDGMR